MKKKTTKKKTKIKKPVKAESKKTQPKIEEPKPEFEAALNNVAGESQTTPESEPAKDGRGGARPGAGRPRGTDDLSRVNRLPQKANETLIPILQMPFSFWSKTQGIKELELADKEAKELALPVTQLLEFYFPGKVPEIAFVWLMFAGSTFKIVDSRLAILAKKRKEKTTSSVAGSKGSRTSAGPIPSAAHPTVDDVKKAASVKV